LLAPPLIIAFFFGIDKVLAFVRQIFIARQFGLGMEIDAFNAANNIPDLLSALISGGALGAWRCYRYSRNTLPRADAGDLGAVLPHLEPGIPGDGCHIDPDRLVCPPVDAICDRSGFSAARSRS
jgi:hypothetical protein